jgi:hypothetical protein
VALALCNSLIKHEPCTRVVVQITWFLNFILMLRVNACDNDAPCKLWFDYSVF